MSETKLYDTVKVAIEKVADQLRRGKLKNESLVKQCAVLPVLRSLKWNTDDADEVISEHSTDSGRVDYALFVKQAQKPRIFIETKAVGKIGQESELQLFRYAFDEGAPMLILTDGQEWNFYLTAGEGKHRDRQFYKINIVEHTPKDAAGIFCDYLFRDAVASGKAKKRAEKALESNERTNVIKEIMPKAWRQLLEEDNSLRDLLAEKVEDICGYKPELEPELEIMAEFFHSEITKADISEPPPIVGKKKARKSAVLKSSRDGSKGTKTKKKLKGFVCRNKTIKANAAIRVLEQAIVFFSRDDKSGDFLERLAIRAGTPKTRLISKERELLFMQSPHLTYSQSREIKIDSKIWWLNICLDSTQIIQHLKKCCEVAGVKYGKDFKIIEE